jgi:hypothetical protein
LAAADDASVDPEWRDHGQGYRTGQWASLREVESFVPGSELADNTSTRNGSAVHPGPAVLVPCNRDEPKSAAHRADQRQPAGTDERLFRLAPSTPTPSRSRGLSGGRHGCWKTGPGRAGA